VERIRNQCRDCFKTTMNILTKIFLFLALTLSAACLSAQAKPNFTGTWELNVPKSDLGGFLIDKRTWQIEHNDPNFKCTAKEIGGGHTFYYKETFTTDGKPVARRSLEGGQITAHWEGATLVAEVSDPYEHESWRITLSADRKTIIYDFVRTNVTGSYKRHDVYDKQ
jgi:hypothetical protein